MCIRTSLLCFDDFAMNRAPTFFGANAPKKRHALAPQISKRYRQSAAQVRAISRAGGESFSLPRCRFSTQNEKRQVARSGSALTVHRTVIHYRPLGSLIQMCISDALRDPSPDFFRRPRRKNVRRMPSAKKPPLYFKNSERSSFCAPSSVGRKPTFFIYEACFGAFPRNTSER